MFNKNAAPKRFLSTLIVAIWFVVFFLTGCGGGGGGGGDSDGGSSSPAYSELDVSFGGVVLDHFADQTLSLQNAGSVNITLGQIEDPVAPFAIVTDGCSGRTLGTSGTCDIQLRFTPIVQGDQESFFTIPLSGSSTNFAGVNLDGTGNSLNLTITQMDTTNCPTVKLIASVTDQYDDFVPGLENYFTLNEVISGGTSAVSGTVIPDASNLSVVLALDSSGSVDDVLPQIRDAAKAFVSALDNGDEVAVFQFSEAADEKTPFTIVPGGTVPTAINDAINSITTASGHTALYSALSYVCDYFGNPSTAATYERRAIVIITDGEDNASTIELEDAIADAQEASIPIFTIGMGAEAEYIQILQELAEDTGGQYYDAPTGDVLDEVYPDIAGLLTNQYEIEYTSNSSGGATVTVELTVEYNGMTGEDSREFVGCSP